MGRADARSTGADAPPAWPWMRHRAAAAAVASVLVTADVIAGGLLVRLDAWTGAAVWAHVPAAWRISWAGGWLSRPGDEWWIFPVLAGAALAAGQRHGARLGAGLFVWGVAGAALVKGLKQLIDRPRPYEALGATDLDPFYLASRSASFPSGHSFDAFVLYGIVAACAVWVASDAARDRVRRVAVWSWLLVAAVVSLSRIAAGLHYPGDVLGSWALGVAWLGLGGHVVARTRPDLWAQLVGARVTPEKPTPTHK